MATTVEVFATNYDAISAKMIVTLDAQMDKLKDELKYYSILPETLADILAKTRSQIAMTVIQTSATSAISVIEQTQADTLNTRRIQGFDDNMLMEITKMQGNVASFFVNSSPTGAQTVLDDLKEMMQSISSRATLVTGTQPAIPASE